MLKIEILFARKWLKAEIRELEVSSQILNAFQLYPSKDMSPFWLEITDVHYNANFVSRYKEFQLQWSRY